MNNWRHPSIIPDADGIYEVCDLYGFRTFARWAKEHAKYGIWRVNGEQIDSVAIAKFKFREIV